MPCKDINQILLLQAAALERVGGRKGANTLRMIAEKCAPKGALISAVDKSLQITNGPAKVVTVEQARTLVDDLLNVLAPAAKKVVLADLGRLAKFLERHQDMALKDLLTVISAPEKKSISPKAIADTLMAVIGDEAFEERLNRIAGDKAVEPKDMVAIAAAMGSELPARTSKKKVVERLLSRHQSLATFKAKERAMAGRSAA